MLAEAAQIAIDTALLTSGTSAVCDRGRDLPLIHIDQVGYGAMYAKDGGTNGQAVRISRDDARSLVVRPCDLVDQFGEQVRPTQGDRWEITLPTGVVATAECMPLDGEPAWRWTDRFQTAYRINVRLRGTA